MVNPFDNWLSIGHTSQCGPLIGVAALGHLKGWIGMSDEERTHRPNLSRRRRENTPAGSKKRRDLWVTAEEEAALVARAARERVTVPNLLISAALSEQSDSPTERRAIAAELMSLHNLLARSSNNINQLAR
ncbi:plasmid mobilization protein, partial [Crystallibacter crystallopoietes]